MKLGPEVLKQGVRASRLGVQFPPYWGAWAARLAAAEPTPPQAAVALTTVARVHPEVWRSGAGCRTILVHLTKRRRSGAGGLAQRRLRPARRERARRARAPGQRAAHAARGPREPFPRGLGCYNPGKMKPPHRYPTYQRESPFSWRKVFSRVIVESPTRGGLRRGPRRPAGAPGRAPRGPRRPPRGPPGRGAAPRGRSRRPSRAARTPSASPGS